MSMRTQVSLEPSVPETLDQKTARVVNGSALAVIGAVIIGLSFRNVWSQMDLLTVTVEAKSLLTFLLGTMSFCIGVWYAFKDGRGDVDEPLVRLFTALFGGAVLGFALFAVCIFSGAAAEHENRIAFLEEQGYEQVRSIVNSSAGNTGDGAYVYMGEKNGVIYELRLFVDADGQDAEVEIGVEMDTYN